jgi:hypothetical protein
MAVTYHTPSGTSYTFIPHPREPVQGAVGCAEATYQDYKFRREPEHFLWEIYAREDGGIVPARLRCRFTNLGMAKAFLRSYLIEEEAKNKKRNATKFKN